MAITNAKRPVAKAKFAERTVPFPHPAAIAAESDLVKLVRELEALRKQREELQARTAESRDHIRAAIIEFNMAKTRHDGIIDMTERTLRVTQVQIENVEDLISRIVRPRDTCNTLTPRAYDAGTLG